eukprot:4510210-Amphidinium_carterae.1
MTQPTWNTGMNNTEFIRLDDPSIYYVERRDFPARGSYADAALEGSESVSTLEQIEWTFEERFAIEYE